MDKERLLTELTLLSQNLDVKWGQCVNLGRALAGYNVSWNTTLQRRSDSSELG